MENIFFLKSAIFKQDCEPKTILGFFPLSELEEYFELDKMLILGVEEIVGVLEKEALGVLNLWIDFLPTKLLSLLKLKFDKSSEIFLLKSFDSTLEVKFLGPTKPEEKFFECTPEVTSFVFVVSLGGNVEERGIL